MCASLEGKKETATAGWCDVVNNVDPRRLSRISLFSRAKYKFLILEMIGLTPPSQLLNKENSISIKNNFVTTLLTHRLGYALYVFILSPIKNKFATFSTGFPEEKWVNPTTILQFEIFNENYLKPSHTRRRTNL